jgi:hypothetical protein
MTGTAEARYKRLATDREEWIQRGREASKFTLPWLMPHEGEPQSPIARITQPWTGIGQRGVNNVASRLLLALLPPTQTFFRFIPDDMKWAEAEREKVAAGVSPEKIAEQKAAIDEALGRMERAVLTSIETSNDRPSLHFALLHLIIPGNCLLYMPLEGGLKVFTLYRYVLRRDPMGKPLEIVVCETRAVDDLPEEARKAATHADAKSISDGGLADDKDNENRDQKTVNVYTHIRWENGKCRWHQEIKGQKFGKKGVVDEENAPWIPLRMFKVDSSDYSPGYVEAVGMADLQTANALSRAVTEGALAAAQLRWMRRSGAKTTAQAFAEADNGAVLDGGPEDFQAARLEKSNDFVVAQRELENLRASLAPVFMLNEARDSERTTAEEVRMMAQQIDNGMAGAYSSLTVELVYPYISRRLYILTKANRLPKLPSDTIRPVVSVGLHAVGRGNDLDRHAQFITILRQLLGPDTVTRFMFVNVLIQRLANSLGIDTVGLIKTQQQIQDEARKAAEAQQREALLRSPAGDPQRLANAAATVQQMAQPQPPETQAP